MSQVKRKASLKFTKKGRQGTPELPPSPVFASSYFPEPPHTMAANDTSPPASPALARFFSFKPWKTPPSKRSPTSSERPPMPDVPSKHRTSAMVHSSSGTTCSTAPRGFDWDSSSLSSLSTPGSTPERVAYKAIIPNITLSLADADAESVIELTPPPQPTWRTSPTERSPPFDPSFEQAAGASSPNRSSVASSNGSTIRPSRPRSLDYPVAPGGLKGGGALAGSRLPSIRVDGLSMEDMFAELEAKLSVSPTYNCLSSFVAPDHPPLPTVRASAEYAPSDVPRWASGSSLGEEGSEVRKSSSKSSLASSEGTGSKRRSVRKSRLSKRMSKPLMNASSMPPIIIEPEPPLPSLFSSSALHDEDERRSSLAYMSRDSVISTASGFGGRRSIVPPPILVALAEVTEEVETVDDEDEYAIFSPRIAQERALRASLGPAFSPSLSSPTSSSTSGPEVIVLPPTPKLVDVPGFIVPCPPVRSSSHRARHDLQHSPASSISSSATTPPLSPDDSSSSVVTAAGEGEDPMAELLMDLNRPPTPPSASASIYRESALDMLGASATAPLEEYSEGEEEGEEPMSPVMESRSPPVFESTVDESPVFASRVEVDDDGRFEDADDEEVAFVDGLGLVTYDDEEGEEEEVGSARTSFDEDADDDEDDEEVVVSMAERVECGFAM